MGFLETGLPYSLVLLKLYYLKEFGLWCTVKHLASILSSSSQTLGFSIGSGLGSDFWLLPYSLVLLKRWKYYRTE